VNRVGDAVFDQIASTGHDHRLDDLDRFADLGLRTLRYPILWERTAPDGLDRADWLWPDERLGRLRELGIRPIVGFVHHGGGPQGISLVDEAFVDGVAAFAGAVARRYPWVRDFNPVNEPLTTARFSGLYGLWYPHGRDDRTFARALITQCRAIAAAMRAIREITPDARLVQTDDLGKVYATPELRQQADFENERRWLGYDLLCGRVDSHHPLRGYLRWVGIDESELTPFLAAPCPPDVVGIDYYLTSDRFLDHRVDRYPRHTYGGNGHGAYADVEAVRVRAAGTAGAGDLLREAWDRFGLPVAVTEAHLGCTREEQVRWLAEVWEAALDLRDEGIDVRAVTAWSLLGSHDWDSLLTRADGHYEPGAFDLRAPTPRPTAVAALVRDLAAGCPPAHPVLGTMGWWRRPDRLLYPPVNADGDDGKVAPDAGQAIRSSPPSPILIVGDGPLAEALGRVCAVRALAFCRLGVDALDPSDRSALDAALAAHSPWAVIHAGAWADPVTAEQDPADCRRAVVGAGTALAAACAARGIALVTFSSDLVFGGVGSRPWVEHDPIRPRSVLGRAEAAAERRVLASHPTALIVRTGPLFGPWDGDNPIAATVRDLATQGWAAVADDATVSPTYVPDVAHAALDLLIDGERGIWHLANAGSTTWLALARRAAALIGHDPARIYPAQAPRPRHVALGSVLGWVMPTLDDALGRFAWERDRSLTDARALGSGTARTDAAWADPALARDAS